ncbi:hypothetical protein [Amycolatopsis sp. NPDC051372]|uniref:hypothetical protein n=1 Tax=Amycolatopsis sp. NPDC051372 TaxID=3155669 RepID=UPI0034320CE9
MRFVSLRWDERHRATEFDAQRYLAELPALAGRLPAGARAFALDAGHYDFYGTTCVKDLTISAALADPGANGSLKIRFEPNRWKHDSGLTIEYENVTGLSFSTDSTPDLLGAVLLDEILPTDTGCSHEIALRHGSVTVECGDLTAKWG